MSYCYIVCGIAITVDMSKSHCIIHTVNILKLCMKIEFNVLN